MRLVGGSWRRVYLNDHGEETTERGIQELIVEVAFRQLVSSATLGRDGALDAAARRTVERLGLSFGDPVEVEPAVSEHVGAVAVTGAGVGAGGGSFPAVRGVWVDGVFVDIKPRGLDEQEAERAKMDEIIFEVGSRAGRRYAEYVAQETWTLARANLALSEADRRLPVKVCVDGRRAIWLEGASYTRVKGAVYDIDVGDSAPITQQPYRKSPAENESCEWHLRKSIALGVLRPHVGAWATPAFVVKQAGKPRGRLVCDYRRVNEVTRRMYHPMPRVDATLRRSAGARFFTGLDAVSGFNHLSLTERAKEVLAICASSGLYAWEALPFGPADGPQAFQAVMQRIFGSHAGLAIYLDDLALATGSPPSASA